MNPTEPPPPKSPGKKRLLLRLFLAFLVLAVLVVASIPTIAGMVAKAKLPGILGEQLGAQVSLEDVSVSWSGKAGISGLKIVPNGFALPLLDLGRAEARISVMEALQGRWVVDVEVVAPKVTIEKGADGRFNYELLSAPAESGEPGSSAPAGEPAAKKPSVQAVLRVRDGEIRIRDAAGETLLGALTVEAKVVALDQPVDYSVSFETRPQGNVSVKGSFDLERKSGPVAVTVQNTALQCFAAAARLYSPVRDLSGTMDAQLAYELKGIPAAEGKGSIEIRDAVLAAEGKTIRVKRIVLSHDGGLDASGKGRHTLTVGAGKALEVAASAEVEDAFGVPVVRAEIDVKTSLAELEDTLRGIVALKEDVHVDGRARLSGRVGMKGPSSVEFDLNGGAEDLTAIQKGVRTEIDKSMSFRAAGLFERGAEGMSVRLDALKLDSTFASVLAEGGVTAGKTLEIKPSTVKVDADLEKLASRLAQFMERPPVVGGKASLQAKLTTDRFDIGANVREFRFGTIGPLDATLKHEGTLDAEGNGSHVLTVESGRALAARVTADVKNAFVPERSVAAKFRVTTDLAALKASAGEFWPLQHPAGVEGEMVVDGTVEGHGTTWARFDVTARGTDLAVEDGRRVDIDKSLMVRAVGEWDGAKSWVKIDDLRVDGSVGTLEARGAGSLRNLGEISASTLRGQVDLGKLSEAVRPFLADFPEARGKVALSANIELPRWEMSVDASGVEAQGAGPLDAKVSSKGTLDLQGAGAVTVESLTVTSAALEADLTAGVRRMKESAREVDFKGKVKVDPVALTKWVRDLGLGGSEVHLDLEGGMRPEGISVKGKVQADGLTRKDSTGKVQAFSIPSAVFSAGWKDKTASVHLESPLVGAMGYAQNDVFLDAEAVVDGASITVRRAMYKAQGIEANASGEWTPERQSVKASLKGDVARLMADLGPKGFTAAGKLESDVSYGEGRTRGTTKIAGFEFSDGKNSVKEPLLSIVHDATVSPTEIKIAEARISASFLNGNLTGDIRNYKTEPEFVALRGVFNYVPDKLGLLLSPWLPGKLEGSGERPLEIRLDGKASKADLAAVLRGSSGGVDIDLAKFTTVGVSIGGKTGLKLENGKANSDTNLNVNGGTAQVLMLLDFRAPEQSPRSTMSVKGGGIAANADMAPILDKINPIFHTVNGTVAGVIESDLNLTWDGVLDPMEKEWLPAAGRSLKGGGSLAVKNLAIEGSPTVKLIMEALGQGNRLEGELSAPDLKFGGGKCEYQNMVLQLKQYQLKFAGEVGFDQQMKLMVEMPLTEHMIKKNETLAKYLGGTIPVPLTGSVASPKLDLERALGELAKRAVENVLKDKATDIIEDKAGDLLDGLFKKKKKKH